MRRFKAFTLSELLIALAILGVIATFTIPKVLQSQQDSRFKSISKETISSVAEAWQLYKLKNKPDANTTIWDLTPYLNYARFSNSAADVVDGHEGWTFADCSWGGCLYTHNGGALYFYTQPFGGTATTNAIMLYFDPDGKVTTSTSTIDGPGKAINFQLYFEHAGNRLSGHPDWRHQLHTGTELRPALVQMGLSNLKIY